MNLREFNCYWAPNQNLVNHDHDLSIQNTRTHYMLIHVYHRSLRSTTPIKSKADRQPTWFIIVLYD